MGFNWSGLGPTGLPAKVIALAADPRTPDTLLFGAPGGGVWRSGNLGVNWTPLTDTAPSLQICALALDPTNQDRIYAGIGDDRFVRPGFGIIHSTDNGKTWSASPYFSATPVCAVAVDPASPNRLLAGSASGIYLSADSGASWKATAALAPFEFAFDPVTNGLVYAAVNSPNFFAAGAQPSPLVRSTDGGATWAEVPLPPWESPELRFFRRASLAVGDPGRLYLAVSFGAASTGTGSLDLYRSTDSGGTWASQQRVSPDGGRHPLLYDHASKILYLAATSVLQATNLEAQTFLTLRSNIGPVHALTLLPGAVAAATDSGIEVVPLDGSAPQSRAAPAIGQLLAVASDPVDANITYAGGESGLRIYQPASMTPWRTAVSASVGPLRVTNTNPQSVFASGATAFYRSANAGATFTTGNPIASGERRAPHPPLLVDPVVPQQLHTAGQRIYRSSNGGQNWAAVSQVIDSSPGTVVVALNFAPAVRNIMFAATVCLPESVTVSTNCPALSRLWVSQNTGATWTQAGAVPGYVTSIAGDPRVAQRAYVTVGSFPGRGPSTRAGLLAGDVLVVQLAGGTGGIQITSIRANLPDAPVNAITVTATGPAVMGVPASNYFVATDRGVFATFNAGQSWIALSGLPNVAVTDIDLRAADNNLRVATYGRGAFVADADRIQTSPTVTPLGASISVLQGQSAAIGVVLANSSTASLDYTIQAAVPWVRASPASGSLAPAGTAAITLTVDAAGLPVGTYHTKLQVIRAAAGPTPAFAQDFTLQVRIGPPPASLAAVAGNGATGNAGTAVTLVAQATDSAGQPFSGLTVAFRITAGSGVLSLPSAATDAQGRATVVLTLPPVAGNVQVTASAAGLTAVFSVTVLRPPSPSLDSGAAVNAASFAARTPVAPGSIISIFGAQLATAVGGAPDLPLPLSLFGTRVLLGGIAAPLFFVSPDQINAQVPFELEPGTAPLQVEYPASAGPVLSNELALPVAAAAPGIFTMSSDGRGLGIFVKGDGTLVRATNPARRGAMVTFYATGLGAVHPPVLSGFPAPLEGPPSQTLAEVVVTIGGQDAFVQFAGLAPGFAGLYQLNVFVPQTVSAGANLPVTVRVGIAVSNTVTIAVQ